MGGVRLKFKVPEGATPIEDTSDLMADGLLTYQDLCAAEAENILKAINLHLKRRKNSNINWFTEEYIRKVHKDMFKNVWRWAGMYRISELNIGVPAHSIREEVAKLCQDVAFWNSNKTGMPILERAVRIHHRLTWIHPFKNGNGRHARFISNIYLYTNNHPQPLWYEPNLSASGEMRTQYLKAIREADLGNFKTLLDLTEKNIKNSNKYSPWDSIKTLWNKNKRINPTILKEDIHQALSEVKRSR